MHLFNRDCMKKFTFINIEFSISLNSFRIWFWNIYALNHKHEKKKWSVDFFFFLHEVKLDQNVSQITVNINRSWSEESRRDLTVRRWLNGDTNLEDWGRLSANDDQYSKAPVEQNPCQSVREISQVNGLHITRISDHLKTFDKKKLNKWIPHEVTESQRVQCFVCLMLFL